MFYTRSGVQNTLLMSYICVTALLAERGARLDGEHFALLASLLKMQPAQLVSVKERLPRQRGIEIAGEQFELIVSNPPYIADGDIHLTQGDLRFEPGGALTDYSDGLSALRQIAAQGEPA